MRVTRVEERGEYIDWNRREDKQLDFVVHVRLEIDTTIHDRILVGYGYDRQHDCRICEP